MIRLADFINRVVAEREAPEPGRVLMKMDIEGAIKKKLAFQQQQHSSSLNEPWSFAYYALTHPSS